MDQPDLIIFGATRNTGLYIAQQAIEQGLSVVAMVREGSDAQALDAINVKIERGDAFIYDDCVDLFHKYQPYNILTTLGGKNAEGRRVDAEGNLNIINAATEKLTHLKRFVFMTSMGCGDQYEQISEQAKQFLGEALRAKTEAENVLKNTTLPWSIIRPCGLNQEAPTGQYRILRAKEPIKSAGYLSRKDVAKASLEIMTDSTYLHQVVTVVA